MKKCQENWNIIYLCKNFLFRKFLNKAFCAMGRDDLMFYKVGPQEKESVKFCILLHPTSCILYI